jgi:plasmid stabilization system protein ParE
LAYSLQITLPARQDIRDYASFIRDEQKSPDAARRWLDGLHAAIEELSEAPYRFAVIPEAVDLDFPYRSFVYQSHRVIYAVYDPEGRVMVHRIYHSARKPLTGKDVR